ncbi:hypothetical protein D3C81_1730060 [compost metagenome]
MTQANERAGCVNHHRIVVRHLISPRRVVVSDGIVNPISFAEYMIAGIGHIVRAVAFDDRGAFRPPAQISVGRRPDIDRIRIRHRMDDDALVSRMREVPRAVIVNKNRAVDAKSQILRLHLKRPRRAIAS